MEERIPKRIIQTYKNHNLPLLSEAAMANVRLLNPDFEYLFFDDIQVEVFIDENFPEYRKVFDSFRFPISRYDFFRYLAVYQYGGFYFDLDVFLASNLSDLLDFGCVFSFEELNICGFLREQYGMDWGIGNFAFGASARHPFMRAVIENCVRAQKDSEWAKEMMKGIPRMFRDEYYVLYTSAPGLVSRTLAEYHDAAKQVKVLFPENVCDSATWNNFGTYGVHLMKGIWRGKKRFFRKLFYKLWITLAEKKYYKQSIKLGPVRSIEFLKKS